LLALTHAHYTPGRPLPFTRGPYVWMEEADGGFSEDRVADRGDAPSSSSSGRPVESEQVRELSILDTLRAVFLKFFT
jgi:hypothetical protein